MANILITGGTGFIGSWVVSKLVGDWADESEKEKNHNVLIVDNATEGAIMPSYNKVTDSHKSPSGTSPATLSIASFKPTKPTTLFTWRHGPASGTL